jgi:hypothetical protein
MVTPAFPQLCGIINQKTNEILEYFKGLNNKKVSYLEFAEKINSELPYRIEQLTVDIQDTTILALDKDARDSIKDWKSVNKNRFYAAKIGDVISTSIKVPEFSEYKNKSL